MPKKTLDTINDSKNYFLIQVKANCRALLRNIKQSTETEMVIDTYETYDNRNGREEYRYYDLFPVSEAVQLWLKKNKWNGITRIVKVYRFGTREGKKYEETAWHILSKPINCAKTVGDGVRGHWGIENKLHYPKDVYFKEDDMPMRNPKKATVIAIMMTIALNLLKINQIEVNISAFSRFSNKVNELVSIIKKISIL